MIVYIIKIIS